MGNQRAFQEPEVGSPNEVWGWSQSGDLLTGRGLVGRGKAVQLQATLPKPDSVTVQFNLATEGICNARAEIVSNVEGNEIRRLVSVIDGMSVTIRGQTVRVTARDFTVAALSNNVAYNVGILMTAGVRGANKQPPLLSPLYYTPTAPPTTQVAIQTFIPVPPGTTLFVPIPEDAGVISVYTTVAITGGIPVAPVPSQGFVVTHQDNAGDRFRMYDPRDFPDWVPLAPNSEMIALTNNTVASSAEFSLVFGIDG